VSLLLRSVLRSCGLAAVLLAIGAPGVRAQTPDPAPADPATESIDLFGLHTTQSERFKIGGEFVAAWSHDGAQAQLGLEKQGRVGMAIVSLSGRATSRVRYFLSVNPVTEVDARPACGERDFFFPNDPGLYGAAGPIVPCDPEDGLKRVDTYNTYALDYISQQGILREGYLDFAITPSFAVRGGRFILPIGFAPREVGSTTAKDMTRIQRLNAEANFGAMVAYSAKRPEGTPYLDAGVMAVMGDGNREKDYDWFYFVNTSLDTNSALTMVASARPAPAEWLDLRFAYKKGFTGSKVERLPTYWASKRNDNAMVVSLKISPTSFASIFGEYARYEWGPTATSSELVGLPALTPVVKPGYYAGATLEAPLGERVRIGTTVTAEEIMRDDSLIQYLTINKLYNVTMGKKDRTQVARFYFDVARLVNVGFFWAKVSNPFPWASGIWPVSGPVAYTGRTPNRYGITVSVRTP